MKKEYIELVKELENDGVSVEAVREWLALKKIKQNKIVVKQFDRPNFIKEYTLEEFLKDIKLLIYSSESIELRKTPNRKGIIYLHEWISEVEYSEEFRYRKKYITNESFNQINSKVLDKMGIDYEID